MVEKRRFIFYKYAKKHVFQTVIINTKRLFSKNHVYSQTFENTESDNTQKRNIAVESRRPSTPTKHVTTSGTINALILRWY